jgi:hypothetical protein
MELDMIWMKNRGPSRAGRGIGGAAAALVICGATVVAGCAGSDGVASLGPGAGDGAGGRAVEVSGQKASAEAMASCLVDAGVEARTEDWADGQAWVTIGGADPARMCYFEGECSDFGAQGGDGVVGTPVQEALERLASAHKEEGLASGKVSPYLIVGDKDMTEAYVPCLEESGYHMPVAYHDPDEEIADKGKYVALENEWVACARENGLPNLADVPPPVADNYESGFPFVGLPFDIDVDLLRSVVHACPPFNVEGRDSYQRGGSWYDPIIDFDVDPDALDEAGMSRLAMLQDIVYEPEEEYYATLAPDSPLRVGSDDG